MPILAAATPISGGKNNIPFPITISASHTAQSEFTITNLNPRYTYSVSGTAGSPILSGNKVTSSPVNTDITLTASAKGYSTILMLRLRVYTYYYVGTYTMTSFYIHGAPCHPSNLPACPATCSGDNCIGACSTNGSNCNHQGGYTTCTLTKSPTPAGYTDQFGIWSKIG